MARINLLPWRAERQKQRQKQFFMMLGSAAVAGLLLWFLVDLYYDGQISGEQRRNAFIDQQIVEVDARIAEIKTLEDKKGKLLARKKVIEELQGNRSQMVHLFDSLVRTVPDGVILTSIKQDGAKLTLEGRTQSNARVSTYMRNFETSGWMTKPELSIIEAKGEDKGLPYVFTLAVTLVNPNDPKQMQTAAGTVNPNAAPGSPPTAAGAPQAAGAAAPAQAGSAPVTPATVNPATAAPATKPAPAVPAQPAGSTPGSAKPLPGGSQS